MNDAASLPGSSSSRHLLATFVNVVLVMVAVLLYLLANRPAGHGAATPVVAPSGNEWQLEVDLVKIRERLNQLLAANPKVGGTLVENEEGLLVQWPVDSLLDAGTLAIRREAGPLLQQLAVLLATLPQNVRIIAYADKPSPEMIGRFPNAWALASAYASSVAQVLAANGVEASRMETRGQGENPAGRRLDILISRGSSAPRVAESAPTSGH
ncbi:MAG: OmpA family protein [Magnetococcales bacterium]|nr:OmpA family protein [Magnetococcales bacterium]